MSKNSLLITVAAVLLTVPHSFLLAEDATANPEDFFNNPNEAAPETLKERPKELNATRGSVSETPGSEETIITKGIFFTSRADEIIKDGRKDVVGIQITDLEVPGGNQGLVKIAEPYLGKSLDKTQAVALKKEIILYYNAQKRPAVVIDIPLQYVGDGVLQILITEKRMGHFTFKGANWWPDKELAKYIHIKQGDEIDEEVLKNDFAWMNQNPFHHSDYKYAPSSEPNEVDIEVTTKDRFPIRFFTSGDNTGNPSTGNDRFSGGLTWGNAFWLDDLLTYQYMTSNFPERYISHTGNYLCLLPWQHSLSLFGNYSIVKPKIDGYTSRLTANQERLRYSIPFKPLYTNFSQSLTFGFDLKYANSSLLNLTMGQVAVEPGIPIIHKEQISQLTGNYHVENRTVKNYWWVDFDGFWSPFHFLPHQSNAAFSAIRPFSKHTYAYGLLTVGDVVQLPKKFSLAGLFRYQRATGALPPTELFTIGGYSTVRGYNEDEYDSDNGLIVNVEFRSPTITPLGYIWKVKDQLTFLGFMDYGIGTLYHSSGLGDFGHQYAWSVGPGLRYLINPYLSFRCDYGFKLHTMPSMNSVIASYRSGFGKWHLGLMLSY